MKFLTATIFLLFFSAFALAHESRPLYVQIKEQSDKVSVTLNIPNTVTSNNIPSISLNNSTEITKDQPLQISDSGYRKTQIFQNPAEVLKGQILNINFPLFNPVLTTIFYIEFSDGTTDTIILAPSEKSAEIAADKSAFGIAKSYAVLGIKHIWEGYDHLLFVACLILITGFSGKLLVTITGFTIAHSVTLALSALDIVRLPIPPIEASIALSIIFLATEIERHRNEKPSITYQYPILVSTSFGLLHGFGFAAVLNEIGLPANGKPIALLFFNVGVEIGQILFVMAILAIAFGWKRFVKADKYLPKLRDWAVYAIGILATFWFFQRIFS